MLPGGHPALKDKPLGLLFAYLVGDGMKSGRCAVGIGFAGGRILGSGDGVSLHDSAVFY